MLGCLITASIFWFNPLISNVDFLPDVIGYMLVIKAFSKSAYIYDFAEDVCVGAKKMCIITAVKFFTIFIVSSLDPSMSLLLSFTFGVVETIFGVPFLNNLFYAYSKMVSDGDTKTYSESVGLIKNFTVAYFIVKLVLAFLPDLTALTMDYSLGNVEFSYLRFRPILIVLSVFLCAIVGVVWLYMYLRYLKRVVTKTAVGVIVHDFENKLANKKSIFVAKDSIRVTMVIAVASIFILDFKFGYTNVDIFQDFVLTAISVLGFLYLFVKGVYKPGKMFISLVGLLCLHVGADIFEIYANKSYFEKYNYASMLKVSEAEDMYFIVCISAFFAALTLVFSVLLILLVMRNNARENILSNAHLFSHSDTDYYLKEFNKRTRKNIIATMVFASVGGIAYVVLVFFRPYAEWLILVDLICEAMFIISFINSILYIHDEVYKRILSFS